MPLEYQPSARQGIVVTVATLLALGLLSLAVYYLTRLEKMRSMPKMIVKPALSVKIAAETMVGDMALYFALHHQFKDENIEGQQVSEPDDASALKALEDGRADMAVAYINNLVGRAGLKIVAPISNILMCGMAKDPSIKETTDLGSLTRYRLVTNLPPESLYYRFLEARLPKGKLQSIVVRDKDQEGERAVIRQEPGEVFFGTEAFCSQYAKYLSAQVYDLKSSIKGAAAGGIPARVLVARESEIAKDGELISRIREALERGYKEVDRVQTNLGSEIYLTFQRLDGRAAMDVSKSILESGGYPREYTLQEQQVLEALRLAEPSLAESQAAALLPGQKLEAGIAAAHAAAEQTYTYRLLTEQEVEEQRKAEEQSQAAVELAQTFSLPFRPNAPPPKRVYSGPVTDELYGIDFPDKEHGWAVGYYGTIIATGDGGAHWHGQHADTTTLLKAVRFVNGTTGWITGVGGIILHTSDGGQHWAQQKSGTDEYLRDVLFFDSANGLVAARTSLLLATSDGGQSWKTQKMFGKRDDRVNRLRLDRAGGVWAVGEFGGIYASADHGASWSEKPSNTKNTLTDICFLDSKVAFATGLGGVLLASGDGGASWQRLASGTSNNLYSIYTGDGRSAVVVGNQVILKISPNGAQGWRAQAVGTDLDLPNDSIWLYTLDSIGTGGPLIAVGMRGSMVSSADAGNRWILRQLTAAD